MMTLTFKITNLHCDACVKVTTMALQKLPGVMEVTVDKTGAGRIVSEEPIERHGVTEALKAKGYDVIF